ncbi:hypothetical protein V6N13_119482 [Hibiscus sabdariffa]|uniref:Uncharacterized protein n=1 Tax=Hibiscus sabdariffa TaxID=183260 RepID=A0ABR2E1D3_9ROSI
MQTSPSYKQDESMEFDNNRNQRTYLVTECRGNWGVNSRKRKRQDIGVKGRFPPGRNSEGLKNCDGVEGLSIERDGKLENENDRVNQKEIDDFFLLLIAFRVGYYFK